MLKLCKYAVMSLEQKIDTEKGEHQDDETDNGYDGRFSAAPAEAGTAMQKGRVQQPGNSGPDFFGVPAPESAPNCFGVDKPGEQADGQHGEPDNDTCISSGID